MRRNKQLLYVTLSLFCFVSAQRMNAQETKLEKEDKKLLSEAYEKATSGDFAQAEAAYRKALAKSGENNTTAAYNLSNLYLDHDEIPAARKRILEAIKNTEDKELIHKAYHNLGNSMMKEKNYQAAIAAYKDALRNNPNDEETRYNYALAKEMQDDENNDGGEDGDDNKQENQDQDQEQDQDQDQEDKSDDSDNEGDNEDQKDKGDQKDEQDKDDGDQDQNDSDEQEDGEDQKNKKEQKKDNDGEGEQEQQKPQKGKLSPEQVQRLLKAIDNQEDKIQEKINAEKAKGSKVKTEKDW